MKTTTIGTLFALVAVASAVTVYNPAYAEHAEDPVIDMPLGSGLPDCEDNNGCFVPETITISEGTTVTWTNSDNVPHNVSSGMITDRDNVGSVFETTPLLMAAGESYEHTFEEAGEYPYFCVVHPFMSGMIIVEEAHAEDDHDKMGDDAMMDDHDKMGDDAMMDDGSKMDGDAMMTGSMMQAIGDGEYTVEIGALGNPTEGEPLDLMLKFMDAEGNMVEHVNYDVRVTQDGRNVYTSASTSHAHEGEGTVTTRSLESDSGLDVRVTFQGVGLPGEEKTGPVGEMVEFEEVPEFGTIAVVVLAAAIVSIVAVTARSSVFPRL